VVVIVYICHFDWFCRSKGSRPVGGSSVNEMNCHFPGGCGGNIPYIFAYTGCHIFVCGYLWSSATDMTKDARSKTVDAPLMLIFKME
jgi:hypothetical protein